MLEKHSSGKFDMYLVRGGVIVDHVPFLLRKGLKDKGNVYVEFNTPEVFNQIAISYNIMATE